jgi:hypothetical protein
LISSQADTQAVYWHRELDDVAEVALGGDCFSLAEGLDALHQGSMRQANR